MNEKLVKRTHCYNQPPSTYSIGPCACGNTETQWSEYEKHLWCDKCNIDFIPRDNGVFDGPIGLQTAALMGIYFDRIDLSTGNFEYFSLLSAEYIDTLDFTQHLRPFYSLIAQDNASAEKIRVQARVSYDAISIVPHEDMKGQNYRIELVTIKPLKNIWHIDFSYNSKTQLLEVINNGEYKEFLLHTTHFFKKDLEEIIPDRAKHSHLKI